MNTEQEPRTGCSEDQESASGVVWVDHPDHLSAHHGYGHTLEYSCICVTNGI